MMGRLFRLAVLAVLGSAVWLVLPSGAGADFGIDEFEAGTCAENVEPVDRCTFGTPGKFYTQAAGHPPWGIIDFTFNTVPIAPGVVFPDGFVRNVRTDLPIGLSVNPEATPQCTDEQLNNPAGPICPPDSQVGEIWLTSVLEINGTFVQIEPVFDVFNMVPPQGMPLRAAFRVFIPGEVDETIYVDGDVEWEGDFHQFFTISDIGNTIPIVRSRMAFYGDEGDGFIRMPTQCSDGETTHLAVASHQNPDDFLHYSATTPDGVDGCENVPFDPGISVAPASDRTDSPTGLTVEVAVPDLPVTEIQSSDVREVAVTLPAGMGFNASSVVGLGACTDAQFPTDSRAAINCPANSRIGSAAIETPSLPEGSLAGNVYVGQPLSDNPASGEQFRLFVEATSERFGVSVRLKGGVEVDPDTGRLTTRFTDLPQAPFETFTVDLDGGPRAVISNPPTCGPHTTTARFVPWSGTGAVQTTSSFTLDRAPGGGPCAETMAERPFAPDVDAGSINRISGEFTRLRIGMSRSDGEQEMKQVDLSLPPGLTARLAGVPYCSEQAIAAARGKSAAAEQSNPSCPANTWLGQVDLAAGTGPSPFEVRGLAYFAGPYGGAPISMVVITPAMAGHYDLGTVVVRVALHVNPVTLQVRALSDEIPHRLRGVGLGLRDIDIAIDRRQFNINPTGCWEKFFTGSVRGGFANPGNPDRWSRSEFAVSYQAEQCARLGFGPQLRTRLFGHGAQLRRSGHPALRAIVRARPHHANIRRAGVRLPPSIQLDQSNIRTVCTREQWANDECPRAAIYGWAVARSPLLDHLLRGPVYLRSSDHVLPDLVADLRGQVRVELPGRIDAVRGMMRTAYTFVPDVPINAFALQLRGGPRGLLVANRTLCLQRQAVASGYLSHSLERYRQRSLLHMNCRGARAR